MKDLIKEQEEESIFHDQNLWKYMITSWVASTEQVLYVCNEQNFEAVIGINE